jgi:DNA-binding NtrC family response regulator
MPAADLAALAGRPLKEMLEDYERSLVNAALASSGGHQRRAAAALGILPSTLHEKMKRLGLKPRPAQRSHVEPEAQGLIR